MNNIVLYRNDIIAWKNNSFFGNWPFKIRIDRIIATGLDVDQSYDQPLYSNFPSDEVINSLDLSLVEYLIPKGFTVNHYGDMNRNIGTLVEAYRKDPGCLAVYDRIKYLVSVGAKIITKFNLLS